MEHRTYEVHNLEEQTLPMIFHYNIRQKGSPDIANWHENIELLYCTAGSGQIICNSESYDVAVGDLIIVNSNLLHSFQTNSRFEYYCLIVDSDFLASNEIPVEKIKFESFVRSDTASALFETVVREIQALGEYRVAGIRAQILSLMVYLARNHSAAASPEEKNRISPDESIKLAIDYINSNFSRHLTLVEIAEAASLSKYYFAREFKKATGMTVVAYINAIRCRNARNLLLTQKYSVSEAAAACGFENNSYFSKTFRNVMGCLPSEVLKIS